MKNLFTQLYGWFFSKYMDMYKPVTSCVFDNHNLGTRWVFEKYITWYKPSLPTLGQFFGPCNAFLDGTLSIFYRCIISTNTHSIICSVAY
jgi:hypothetical protein